LKEKHAFKSEKEIQHTVDGVKIPKIKDLENFRLTIRGSYFKKDELFDKKKIDYLT